MNDINMLKEISLSEVARKTHIETEYLSYIVNKDFENLVRLNLNAQGFVKILQREYNIDFAEWISEYNLFLQERGGEIKQKTISIPPKIQHYTDKEGKSSRLVWVVALLLLIGCAAWFLNQGKYLQNLSSIFEDKNQSISYINSVVVEQAKQNLDTLKEANLPKTQGEILQTNSQNQEANQTLGVEKMQIQIKQNEANESVEASKPEFSLPLESVKTEVNETIEGKISQNEAKVSGENEYSILNLSEVTIIPKSKVWIGMIEVEDGKKRTLNSDKPVKIPTDKELLVVTGHGDIVLNIGEERIKFDVVNPKRFHIKQDKMRLITFDEFIELNKGKKW